MHQLAEFKPFKISLPIPSPFPFPKNEAMMIGNCINEDAKIDNAVKLTGIISQKTQLAHIPWVTNVQHELNQLEEDKKRELAEMDAQMKVEMKNTPKPIQNNSSGGDN